MAAKGKDWGDVNPRLNRPTWEDKLQWHKLENGKFERLRAVGGVSSYGRHWVEFLNKKGEKKGFPIPCYAYSQKLEAVDPVKSKVCPGCKLGIRLDKFYFSNFIVRSLQAAKPRHPSLNWSPTRAIRIPVSAAKQIKDAGELNVVVKGGMEKSYPVSNDKYGCDIHVKFDEKESARDKYRVQKGKRMPLTEEERRYKLQDLSVIDLPPVETIKQDLIRVGVLKVQKEKDADVDIDLDLEDDALSDFYDESDKKKGSKKMAKKINYAKVQADELDDMAKADLLEIIKAQGVDIKLKDAKAMTEKKLRKAMAELMEAEDEEGPDLGDMDKKELLAYIKDNDLDIEGAKKMTEKKLRQEIQAALESAESEEEDDEDFDDEDEEDDEDFDDEDEEEDEEEEGEEEDDDEEEEPPKKSAKGGAKKPVKGRK